MCNGDNPRVQGGAVFNYKTIDDVKKIELTKVDKTGLHSDQVLGSLLRNASRVKMLHARCKRVLS